MYGWAGPLIILRDLVVLGLALFFIITIAAGMFWLAAQLWFWLLLGGLVLLGGAAWGYRHYGIPVTDGKNSSPPWCWELPEPVGQPDVGYKVVPVAVQPAFCDQCGNRLVNGTCQICGWES